MRRRLYFVLPDLASAIGTANDLLLARVEDKHMHFLGRRGMSLGELHEASFFQKSDLRHALMLGVGLGVIGGMVLGLYLKLTPIGGFEFGLGTLFLCVIGGGLFGGWSSTLVGLSTPNQMLKPFEREIEAGRILLMIDVPVARVEDVQALVAKRQPEVADRGVEPMLPVFP